MTNKIRRTSVNVTPASGFHNSSLRNPAAQALDPRTIPHKKLVRLLRAADSQAALGSNTRAHIMNVVPPSKNQPTAHKPGWVKYWNSPFIKVAEIEVNK